MNNRLKLYYIENSYIDYLREFDSKVYFNKNATRPYVGVVYTFNNNNYFAPLSSPKPKHLKLTKNAIDIWKIDNGKLGIINFNNMVQCPIEVLTEVITTVKDIKYTKLLENQISSINSDKDLLMNKLKRFQKQYRLGLLPINVLKRCCNFELLEQKCREFNFSKI